MLDAIEFLQARRAPLTLAEALTRLRGNWEEYGMLACYRHSFPQEWGRSQARRERDREREAYSPAEIEFLQLVDRQLFPIPYLTDEDLTTADPSERAWDIPIMPCGRDWYEESSIEPGWQVLLLIAGYELEFELTLDRLPGWKELQAVLVEANARHARLLSRAAHAPAPFSSLPLAFQVATNSTDNLWLDSTPELPAEGWYWCIENVELIQADWEASVAITRQVNELVEYLGADPLPRLQEMLLCLLKW